MVLAHTTKLPLLFADVHAIMAECKSSTMLLISGQRDDGAEITVGALISSHWIEIDFPKYTDREEDYGEVSDDSDEGSDVDSDVDSNGGCDEDDNETSGEEDDSDEDSDQESDKTSDVDSDEGFDERSFEDDPVGVPQPPSRITLFQLSPVQRVYRVEKDKSIPHTILQANGIAFGREVSECRDWRDWTRHK